MISSQEFGWIYEAQYGRTVAFLLKKGLSKDVAKETAQAAWVRGWVHRAELRNRERLSAWVNTIAINLFRSALRRERKEVPLPTDPGRSRPLETSIDAQKMLCRCRHRDRRLLELRYLGNYTIGEIADKVGCSAVAVRVRLFRIRRKLLRSSHSSRKR